MKPPCVLIVDCGSILVNAFESLSEGGMKFATTVSHSRTLADLFFEISTVNPDCVIMCESMPLTSQEALGNLIMTYPRLRVVIVSEDSNVLMLLSKVDIRLNQLSDLFNIISPL